MSDFFDHLFDPSGSGKRAREQIRYRERIRALILEAPAVRRIPPPLSPEIIPALILPQAFVPSDSRFRPYEVFLQDLGSENGVNNFRQWKNQDQTRPIWRTDPIGSEEQVLETRAMGADAYCLDVKGGDLAALQFLVEVGRDYGLPAVLCCESAEDLALALQVQDAPYLRLRGEVASIQLLSLDRLKDRIVIMPLDSRATVDPDWVCSLIVENKLPQIEDEP
jgi:hypothetical protein